MYFHHVYAFLKFNATYNCYIIYDSRSSLWMEKTPNHKYSDLDRQLPPIYILADQVMTWPSASQKKKGIKTCVMKSWSNRKDIETPPPSIKLNILRSILLHYHLYIYIKYEIIIRLHVFSSTLNGHSFPFYLCDRESG